jgi:hypothetical protein
VPGSSIAENPHLPREEKINLNQIVEEPAEDGVAGLAVVSRVKQMSPIVINASWLDE